MGDSRKPGASKKKKPRGLNELRVLTAAPMDFTQDIEVAPVQPKAETKKEAPKFEKPKIQFLPKAPEKNVRSEHPAEVYCVTKNKIIPVTKGGKAPVLKKAPVEDVTNDRQLQGRVLTNIPVESLPKDAKVVRVQPNAPQVQDVNVGRPFIGDTGHSPQTPGPRGVRPAGDPVYSPVIQLGPTSRWPAGVPRTFLVNNYMSGYSTLQQPQGIRPNQPTPTVYGGPTPQFAGQSPFDYNPAQPSTENAPIYPEAVQQDVEIPRAYSPSDVYANSGDEQREGSESPDLVTGHKRLSAYDRLGPIAQAKKPKLTINLSFNKEKAVRQVVDAGSSDDKADQYKYVRVHEKPFMTESKDDVVRKFLDMWPWKKCTIDREVTLRTSKSVMMMEMEQMEELYDRFTVFFKVGVKGYPLSWTKEDVMDAVLENLKGKSFIPCMIDFSETVCRFLVTRCRDALMTIHKLCFCIRKDDVELILSISQITPDKFQFLPRLVLRKLLSRFYDGEAKLSLKEFTLQKDLSHCIYFPLNRLTNQAEVMLLESDIVWNYLTQLDLSNNRITSLEGFNLSRTTPKLRELDLSNNCIDKITVLLNCRELPLKSLKLEGNPLCFDYIDARHYLTAARMIYPCLKELDGVPIQLKGDLPLVKGSFCPDSAQHVIDRFFEIYIPLLESDEETRLTMNKLYKGDALLTVTYNEKMRYTTNYRNSRSLFNRSRELFANDYTCIETSGNIAKHISKWPMMEYDKSTMTVDVMFHNEHSTVFRACGLMKMAKDSLAEEEWIIAYTKTIVLVTLNQTEYKVANQMVYWDLATPQYAAVGFRITTVKPKSLCLQMESPPDDDLKHQLCQILVKLTDLTEERSRRCLETKDWNLKEALAHFMKLLKVDTLQALDSVET